MNPIEDWLLHVAAKKAVLAAVKFIVSAVTAGVIAKYLKYFGVSVDPVTLQASLTAAGMAGLEAGHDYLRLRFPSKWW